MAKPANPRPAPILHRRQERERGTELSVRFTLLLQLLAAAIVQTFRRRLYRPDFWGEFRRSRGAQFNQPLFRPHAYHRGRTLHMTRPVISMDHCCEVSFRKSNEMNRLYQDIELWDGRMRKIFFLCFPGPCSALALSSSALDAPLQDSARHRAHCAVQQHCRHASEVWTMAAWRRGS